MSMYGEGGLYIHVVRDTLCLCMMREDLSSYGMRVTVSICMMGKFSILWDEGDYRLHEGRSFMFQTDNGE